MNGPVRRKIDSTAKLEKEDRSISFMSGQKAEQTVCLAVGFASIHLAADVNEQNEGREIPLPLISIIRVRSDAGGNQIF
ncbi:hypothetical protein ACFQDF_31160 [Ectobacillus funiculus]|uniref:Uncharacterized protein n=1 Tax=Ectobacillus funiculus TaxID=137993 RepID=A0ABV5WCJ8_9BACI